MKIVKRILLALLAIVVLLVLIAFLLPANVHVERSLVINAPAEVIFSEVNSLKKWEAWSPWHAMEPDATYKFSGPDAGVDAKSEWEGEKIGKGSQTIVESVPNEMIKTSLDFGDQGTATADWKFESEGQGTKVTWGFDCEMGMNPIARYMGLMMDSWIGADYEKGLNSLKEICENKAAIDPSTDDTAEFPTG